MISLQFKILLDRGSIPRISTFSGTTGFYHFPVLIPHPGGDLPGAPIQIAIWNHESNAAQGLCLRSQRASDRLNVKDTYRDKNQYGIMDQFDFMIMGMNVLTANILA